MRELRAYPSDTALPVFLPTEACFKLGPPERLSGIWYDALEGSYFLPGVASPGAIAARSAGVWINRDQIIIGRPKRIPASGLRVFWVSFIGRRTLPGGRYGSADNAQGEVVVDRVIAVHDAGSAL